LVPREPPGYLGGDFVTIGGSKHPFMGLSHFFAESQLVPYVIRFQLFKKVSNHTRHLQSPIRKGAFAGPVAIMAISGGTARFCCASASRVTGSFT
jgi:hypothetical protein